MAHYPLTPEHRCQPDGMAFCWHVRGSLPDGSPLAAYAVSDASVAPVVSVRMEHPDALITSVVFGRFDEEHAARQA
jgi:hypothetical protein